MSSPHSAHGPWLLTSPINFQLLKNTVNLFSMLSDMLDLAGPEQISSTDYLELTEAFGSLVAADAIHPIDIRLSGLVDALEDITANKSQWPFAVRGKARALMKSWEVRFGRKFFRDEGTIAQRVLNDPAGLGAQAARPSTFTTGKPTRSLAPVSIDQPKAHRMLNLPHPVKSPQRSTQPPPQLHIPQNTDPRSKGLVRSRPLVLATRRNSSAHTKVITNPQHPGSLNLEPGQWWPGPAGAAKDGVIIWSLRDKEENLEQIQESSSSRSSSPSSLPSHHGVQSKATPRRGLAMKSNTPCSGVSFQTVIWRPEIAEKADQVRTFPFDDYLARCVATAVTYDEFGAYAILLSGDLEEAALNRQQLIFAAHASDPGRKSLMKNLRTQDPVRVLRSCYQFAKAIENGTAPHSDLRPRAGVRYDGLYRVVKYSLKTDNDNRDIWLYRYTLERCEGQTTLETALQSPDRNEVLKALEKKTRDTDKGRGLAGSGAKESMVADHEYWNISLSVLKDWAEADGSADYAKAQRDFASAAIQKLMSNQ